MDMGQKGEDLSVGGIEMGDGGEMDGVMVSQERRGGGALDLPELCMGLDLSSHLLLEAPPPGRVCEGDGGGPGFLNAVPYSWVDQMESK